MHTAAAHPGPYPWEPARAVRLTVWIHAFALVTMIAWPEWWTWLLAVLLGNHVLLGGFGMLPRSGLLGPNLVRLPAQSTRQGLVALTFDDGPDPDVTPLVLDLLDRHRAKASFFCIGERAAEHPDIVRDIVRRGHSVENHSRRHPRAFACYLPHALNREIAAAQVAVEAITGRPPRFFRAPMGLRSPFLDPVVAHSGLRYVSWTRRGWDCVSRDPAAVLHRLTRGLVAGDVILLHDGSCARTRGGEPLVLAVLPKLLQHLDSGGLQAVSLPMALATDDLASDNGAGQVDCGPDMDLFRAYGARMTDQGSVAT